MSERRGYDPCGNKLVETEKLTQGDFESIVASIVSQRDDEWFMQTLGEIIDTISGGSG